MEIECLDILNTYNEINSKSLTTLSILGVATRLELKDYASAKRWLEKKGIKIYKELKSSFVYEIDVNVEIDKLWVKDLSLKYPANWEEIYKISAKDETVCKIVVLSLKGEIVSRPTTKLKLKDNNDKELYRQLTA